MADNKNESESWRYGSEEWRNGSQEWRNKPELTDWRQFPDHMIKHNDELEANMATQLFKSFKRLEAIMEEHHQPAPFFKETTELANKADTLMAANEVYDPNFSVRGELPTREAMGAAWKHWAAMEKFDMVDFDEVMTLQGRDDVDIVETGMVHVTSTVEGDLAMQRFFLVDCEAAIRDGTMTYPMFRQKFMDNFVDQEGDEGHRYLASAKVFLNNLMVQHRRTTYEGFENIGEDSEALLQSWYVHARAEIVIEQQQELLAQVQAGSSDKPIETSSLKPVDVENVGEKDKTVLAASN